MNVGSEFVCACVRVSVRALNKSVMTTSLLHSENVTHFMKYVPRHSINTNTSINNITLSLFKLIRFNLKPIISKTIWNTHVMVSLLLLVVWSILQQQQQHTLNISKAPHSLWIKRNFILFIFFLNEFIIWLAHCTWYSINSVLWSEKRWAFCI